MKHTIHKLICWYLRRCGDSFHCYPYGPDGRYVALMTEAQYNRYNALARGEKVGQQVMYFRNLMRSQTDSEEEDEALKKRIR